VRRVWLAVLAVTALVAAYSLGQDRGIRLGVEETTKFYWQHVPRPSDGEVFTS
jgi:hypothetical protein